MNLRQLLDSGAGDRHALRQLGALDLTYDAVRANVDALARDIARRGLPPGDRIAAALPNGLAVVLAFFGIAAARAVAAPLNPAYTRDEFAFYLADIAPAALFVPPGGAELARAGAQSLGIPVIDVALGAAGALALDGEPLVLDAPRSEPGDDDVALFLHTSGTTSRPKGVPLTHENLAVSARNIAQWYGLCSSDVSVCVMPLFHVHGLVFSTLATLLAGGCEIVLERFSAGEFWPVVQATKATVVSAVPTIYRTLLLRAERDGAPGPGRHTLRFMRSSSAALPAHEMPALEERFGVPVIEAYSMTEASHQICANPLDGERRPGCVGIGAHVDVAIMNELGEVLATGTIGEVAVRGPNVTRGYHNNPEANATAFTNGWFRTGDLGRLDESGYLTLAGRLKELINRGGEKISPVEVDEALLSCPGVKEAVSFGVPDEKYGEVVAAAVVVDGTTADVIREHVASRLASFKVPQILHVVDAIPKTATGKVQRRIVAATFATGAPRRAGV